ncbi:Wadjet anti-phage system protein JetD domain-containing protein [Pseudomonas defluvii]|uniref:Wadjet anti-phage system protein JetD domain-containing protein n=1 Tax=Pseudomonas defluvii TaxID=1876757 RepID=UPI003905C2D6
MLGDVALARLLARAERARLSGSTRTIRESFKSHESAYWKQNLDERDQMHAHMQAAKVTGAIELEWAKQGGNDRPLEAIVLRDLDKLAQYLGVQTVGTSVAKATGLLAPWKHVPRVIELLSNWSSLKQVRSLGPDSAADFVDALQVLDAVSGAKEDQVLRQLSVQLFRNSKRLEALCKHIDILTAEASNSPARHWSEVFGSIGISKEPQPFLVAGTGQLRLIDGAECPIARPFLGVANSAIAGYQGQPEWLLTIENLTTFHQAARVLVADLKGVVIYTAGMPSPSWGKAYVRILSQLPRTSYVYHWGDHDEGGFRIAARIAQLAAQLDRSIQPWSMASNAWEDSGQMASKQQLDSMVRSALKAGWQDLAAELRPILLEQEGQPLSLPSK